MYPGFFVSACHRGGIDPQTTTVIPGPYPNPCVRLPGRTVRVRIDAHPLTRAAPSCVSSSAPLAARTEHTSIPTLITNTSSLCGLSYHYFSTFLPPSVFLNTNPPLLTHHKLIYNNFPAMDTFKQKQNPLDNPLSIPLSIMYHHASMDSMSTSFHFTHARELEQMKLKQEKFYALRHARIQKQKEKLDNCSELPKCCSRCSPRTHTQTHHKTVKH